MTRGVEAGVLGWGVGQPHVNSMLHDERVDSLQSQDSGWLACTRRVITNT